MLRASVGKWVSGSVLGLFLAGAIYFGYIKPNTKPIPTTIQNAGAINNYYNQPRISFGCASWNIPKKDLDETNQ